MDKKKNLLAMVLSLCNMYGVYDFEVDDEYFDDPEIIDCQLKLYLLLLTDDKELSDKLFIEFEELYNKLSEDKKEYIKKNLKKIFENQDKHNKEKEKKYE